MLYFVGSSFFLSSEDLDAFLLAEMVASGVSFLSGVVLIALAVFRTPDFLRVHRVSLLNLTISTTLLSFIVIFLAPSFTVFQDVYCLEILGMVHAPYVATSVILAMTVMLAFAMVMSFVFRYVQLAGGAYCDVLISNGFAALLTLIDVVLLGATFLLVHVLQVDYPAESSLPPEFARPLREQRERQNSVLCFAFHESSQKIGATIFCSWIVLCIIAMVIMAVLTVLRMRSQKALVSKRTYELQKMMATVVFINASLPVLFGWLPLCALIAAFHFFPSILTVCLNMQSFMINTMCFFLNLISIIYLRPYREAILTLLRLCRQKVLGRKSTTWLPFIKSITKKNGSDSGPGVLDRSSMINTMCFFLNLISIIYLRPYREAILTLLRLCRQKILGQPRLNPFLCEIITHAPFRAHGSVAFTKHRYFMNIQTSRPLLDRKHDFNACRQLETRSHWP
uniref:G_PROTEIN_RECEP_F1_2 domain-containing protein n=1 Tax=Steinernema glaseri TaxID=37863 RepID=A0A1I7ZSF3_9BILA